MPVGSKWGEPEREIQMTHKTNHKTIHKTTNKIILNGEKFQLEEVVAIARQGVGVAISVESEARIKKARQLVGVRGASILYNGLYYVKKVDHKIKRGSYKQSFELSRNGLISTIPKVVA